MGNKAKDNKLIAEFMGGIPSSVPNLINLPQTIGQSRILCVKGSEGLPNGTYEVKRISDLEYHKSWVWLMPVCQKIDQYLEDNIGNAGHFDDCLSCNDIDAKYKAVVKFINQLNN